MQIQSGPEYHLVEFPSIAGLVLTAVHFRDAGRVYFPIASTCSELGLDVRGQRDRLKRDYEDHIARLRLPTQERGMQELLCISHEAFAFWLSGLQASRVREKYREMLRAFRDEVMRAAGDILTGRHQPVTVPTTKRGEIDDVLSLALETERRVSRIERDRIARDRAVFVSDPTDDVSTGDIPSHIVYCPHCGGMIRVAIGDLKIVPGEG